MSPAPLSPAIATGHTFTEAEEKALAQLWIKLLNAFDNHELAASELAEKKHSFKNRFRRKKKNRRRHRQEGDITRQPSNGSLTISTETASSSHTAASSAAASVAVNPFYTEFWDLCAHHHPDAILARFLRARKWDVEKAFTMLWTALKWRIQFEVDAINEKGEPALLEQLLNAGVAYFHKTDVKERPVIVLHACRYDKSKIDLEESKKFAVYVMETAKNYFVNEKIETVTLVFDLVGLSLSNVDMSFVKFMISCLEAYYPESLGICLVLNAPMIFSGIWKVIKPLLDPVVASKVVFSSYDKMHEYIPKENLGKHFNKEKTYEYKYILPKEDEKPADKESGEFPALVDKKHEQETLLSALTKKWADSFVSTGKADPKERNTAIAEYRKHWFAFEPYRHKTIYHRLEVLGDKGSVSWSKVQ